MQVISNEDFNKFNINPVVMAIGTFDGLHLGHKSVIMKTIEIAEEKKLFSGVYTFIPHPLKIINPSMAPLALVSREQKINLFDKLGVNYYFEQFFTKEFSRIDFKTFVKEVLIDKLNVKHIVVGEDFKFGYKSKGNVKVLEKMGKEQGFSVTGVETKVFRSRRVSSTLIRKLIKKGEVDKVPAYLGRYYQIDGRVTQGKGIGKKLGFPTANIVPVTDYTLPPNGVYAVFVYYKGKKYKAIANFGIKPTFNDSEYTIEVHIFDIIDNLYGEKLTIELVDFIREEMTFDSIDDLVEQIKKDILYTDSLLCYNK